MKGKIKLPQNLDLQPEHIYLDDKTDGQRNTDTFNMKLKKIICEGLQNYENNEQFVDFLQEKVNEKQNRKWSVCFDVEDPKDW